MGKPIHAHHHSPGVCDPDDDAPSGAASGNLSQPAALPLQFLDIDLVSSNKVAFLFNTEAGTTYQLQYKNDLNTTNWSAGPNIGAVQGLTAYIHTAAGALPDARYYRLKKVQ